MCLLSVKSDHLNVQNGHRLPRAVPMPGLRVLPFAANGARDHPLSGLPAVAAKQEIVEATLQAVSDHLVHQ